ncbi:hypothetical protein CYY_009465 [Polysphondylium violaceum]|uniref:Alpha-mannosidase n=1 Tax=Polysphondylium violaceum TaxID=133409 RepID=A0A8J4PMT3_9MYCE|nr:hypothetical protein CYY_009465 [Polysphondylium violaceum]
MFQKFLFFSVLLIYCFFSYHYYFDNAIFIDPDLDIDVVNKGVVEKNVERKALKIHLIPHSHCDASWLATFEEYYKSVEVILDSITNVLKENPSRKFNWSDIAFFKEWWRHQNLEKRELVLQLVKNKQLEFMNGGWVQNDEACTTFIDIIDQMTLGHQWLKKNLNVSVSIGWQIDPFGYSSITPTIYTEMGFRALVINRVPDYTKEYMINNKEMEFIWRGTNIQKSDLFVTTIYEHYTTPASIYFTGSTRESIEDRAKNFIEYCHEMSRGYKSNNLLVPLGGDFEYLHAKLIFEDIEKIISHIKENSQEYGIQDIKLSSLSEYFDAVQNDIPDSSLMLYTKDFFPYKTRLYWSGYFSSHPVFKRVVRESSALLRAVENIYSMAFSISKSNVMEGIYQNLKSIRENVALMQHHDSITGTARSYVLKDSLSRLISSKKVSYEVVSDSLNYLLSNNHTSRKPQNAKLEQKNVYDLKENEIHSLVIHNPLAWDLKQHISIRITCSQEIVNHIVLLDSKSDKIEIQLVPIVFNQDCKNSNQYSLFFIGDIPALGINTFFLKVDTNSVNENLSKISSIKNPMDIVLKSNQFTVEFNSNGFISKVNQINLVQSSNQYLTDQSGAYVFSPKGKVSILESLAKNWYFIEGPLIKQLISFHNDVCLPSSLLVHRLYSNDNGNFSTPLQSIVETGYSIVGDFNRETTFNFKIDGDFSNTDNFYTDNGVESRVRYITSPQIEANYFPAIHYASVLSRENKRFNVFVDRPFGVTSPTEGEIEIMVHRNLMQDDGGGLLWPNNDFTRSDGKLYLNFENDQSEIKKMELYIDNSPIILTSIVEDIQEYKRVFKTKLETVNSFPKDLHLLSLKTYDVDQQSDNYFLGLRIETINHNTPIPIDLSSIFKGSHVSMTIKNQTNLSFNNIQDNNVVVNNFKTLYNDYNFPMLSGGPQFNYDTQKSIVDSFIIEFKFNTSGNIDTNSNNNGLDKNELTLVQKEIELQHSITETSEENRYLYDFSVYVLDSGFYDDRGRYDRVTDLIQKLLLVIIVPLGVCVTTVLVIVILRKKKLILMKKDSEKHLSHDNYAPAA